MDFTPDNNGLPPQNIDAEEAILGSILFDPSAIEKVFDRLQPNDFYVQAYHQIYQVMVELHAVGSPTDLLTVSSLLANQKLLDSVGGKSRLVSLTRSVVTAVNIEEYANLVIDKSTSRRLGITGSSLVASSYDESLPISDRLTKAENSILEIAASRRDRKELATIQVTSYEVFEQLDIDSQNGKKEYLSTGLDDLDKLLNGGFYPGNLIVVGARPGAGKTVLSCKFAYQIANNYNRPTLIISLEMDKESITQRYLSEFSGVPLGNIRRAVFNSEQREAIARAAGIISNVPVFVDDSSSLNINDAKSIIRKAVLQKGVCAVIIDYLQLMDFGRSQNLSIEIGLVTRELKKLAKQLKVPIIVLSQLSRGVESRSDKRPMSSDLRESGAIESDADVILMLYRDEYYNKNTHDKGTIEIICTKHRNGETGTVKALFHGNYCRVANLR